MSYRLEFELPGLPRMANIASGRSHWRYAHQEAATWKQAVKLAVGPRKPKKPLPRYRLILTRFSSVEPDFDGLTRGFKSLVDGLKMAGVIEDDKLSNSGAWDCQWDRARPREGKVRVVVEEVKE